MTPGVISGAGGGAAHLLHVFPAFGLGGVPIRICGIINALGPTLRHSVIALDGCTDSRVRLDPAVTVAYPEVALTKPALPLAVARAYAVLRRLRPDLVMTYNWGAVEWALAAALRPSLAHIHCESGFGPEEAGGQIRRRVLFRRLALARARRLVVPSQTLVRLATEVWKLDPGKLSYIPNGVDTARFGAPADPAICARLGLEIRAGGPLIGTAAPLRPEKNLERLLRAFAALDPGLDARLAILGEGRERARLTALAGGLGLEGRVTFTGHVEEVAAVLGALDLFVMSSDTEQMPNSLIQAMAAGLPVAATDVGDVGLILAEENRPYAVPAQGHEPLARAIATLLSDAAARRRIGAANRARVEREYRQEVMVARYRALIAETLGEPLDRALRDGPCASSP